jgi:thiol-disulfide isomerase/thioredoxin
VIRPVLIVPALVLLGGALAGCAGASAVQSGPAGGDSRYVAGNGVSEIVKDRKPAPAVQGTTLDGKPLSLADFKGKITVVNFWASWCAPCRAEAPTMQKVYDETKASGVQFVGVDVKDARENAQAFARTFKITYPSLFDQPGQVALAFHGIPPSAVPATLVIDRHGNVAARAVGSVPFGPLHELVTQLAAEK